MKSLIAAAVAATGLAPTVSNWFSRLQDAIKDALRTRAEVSALMADAYRRQD